ncbi:hypothetical protein ABB37_04523 [Leptomonas pyrrhocoris]|uniref:Sulfite exporter TauE/SafE n=1 Tax=Leptomonas pyrrhocoris TaxID=157538 RepID=A0A0M9G2S1_LEPPY|nr:hypothetical protein ABB37_04523 [Leptomonas pyrrhocoris]KPA81185.1 hypothetical protein ABB37_04523 [Leptomonas pyrrhocoris]|eukprot:XP_015659624.1 hypothetical protein ABB37_04523 [Leptomonas pyrrhocoris]
MSSTLTVLFFLILFNLSASIIQGVTGFGDAILLQVLWYTATVISPDIFNATALGDSPVRAVTLLMYCRIVFSTPVLAYMSLHDGVFSLQMTIAMAIPSTLTALGGIFIFRGATSEELKLVLGISGLAFAAMYVVTLIAKYVLRRRKLRRLGAGQHHGAAMEATAVTILPETDAVEADLNASRNSSFTRESAPQNGGQPSVDAASPAFVSISTGSPFRRTEAEAREVTESGAGVEVPPLTPSKLSPSNTMSYTRVRVNRNLDENGKIKLSTKIGAAIAAAVSGIMGSLTGVGAPPQIMFILLFDVPQYIMRVNFAMQSIPSAALRFIYACSTGLFTKEMIPLFATSVISGYLGIYFGVKLGKMLGPKSYNVFVLVLLLLSSLVMITESVAVLVGFTACTTLLTVGAAVYEHRQTAAKVKLQVEMETELEERRRGAAPNTPTGAASGSATPPPADAPKASQTAAAAPGPRSTLLSRQATADATPPSPSLSSETRDPACSRTVSCPALADTASVSTGVSSRTSSRIRRAEQHRPPPLWEYVDGTRTGAAEAAAAATRVTANAAARARSMLVSVPAAGEIAAQKPLAADGRRGMGAEEVKRWVELQDEEIDAMLPHTLEPIRGAEE